MPTCPVVLSIPGYAWADAVCCGAALSLAGFSSSCHQLNTRTFTTPAHTLQELLANPPKDASEGFIAALRRQAAQESPKSSGLPGSLRQQSPGGRRQPAPVTAAAAAAGSQQPLQRPQPRSARRQSALSVLAAAEAADSDLSSSWQPGEDSRRTPLRRMRKRQRQAVEDSDGAADWEAAAAAADAADAAEVDATKQAESPHAALAAQAGANAAAEVGKDAEAADPDDAYQFPGSEAAGSGSPPLSGPPCDPSRHYAPDGRALALLHPGELEALLLAQPRGRGGLSNFMLALKCVFEVKF